MEFVLFNQDPRYVLLKRPAKDPEEARTLFDVATGQRTLNQIGSYDLSRLKLDRSDLGLPGYDPNNKSRLFRDASVFGDTVYLPKGASGHWIPKVPGGAFSGKIDTIATALLQASSPDATRGRLARAMKAAQEKDGLKLEPISGKDGLTSVAILQHFAFWLQADMPDLCFDWTLMQRQCSDMWKAIYAVFEEKEPLWDKRLSQFGKSPQMAANAIITTSPIEGHYPRFMELAREVLAVRLEMRDDDKVPFMEVCLRTMIKDHNRTAAMITDDGPLSVEYLYRNWRAEDQEETRRWLDAVVKSSRDVNASLKELFMAQGMRSMMGKLQDGDQECSVM
jgi:hypothetical protein